MGRIAAILAVTAIIGFVALQGVGSSQPASAGVLPPAGSDAFPGLQAMATIDLSPIDWGIHSPLLTGDTIVQRGDPILDLGTGETTIDIEIVALSLTSVSPVEIPGVGPMEVFVGLNPDPKVPPSTGQIIIPPDFPTSPAESFFDVYLEVDVGSNIHNTSGPVSLSAPVTKVPIFDSHWNSGAIQNEIVSKFDGFVPGALTNFDLWFPPQEKTYTVTVMKQHDGTKAGLPGWEMNIYRSSDCSGIAFDSATTGADGLAEFAGLAAGTYSVEEKLQPGWNNVTPLCQQTSVPATAGVAGLPACPIQPNAPFPEPGCDEFNSAATVKMEFTNPPSDPIDCDLGGPTQITRSAVTGSPDNIQTEIVAMELTGLCAGAVNVTVHESSARRSTGKITEQQNDISGVLEFSADSFFDVFFDVDVGGTILHNQEPIRMECKIDEIPPYSCLYEPNIGTVLLYNADKKEVGRLIHAAHVPLDPKKKLLVFKNAPKPEVTPTATIPGVPTVTPTPTFNPEFAQKIDVCIDAQVIAATPAIWSKAQIDTLVDGADAIWAPANINITWNNNIADIDDPNSPPAGSGQVGDIIDTFKDDAEFISLGDNANSSGKEKCVRVFFIRNFIDNNGAQYETADGDVTLAEVDGKGAGHYMVFSLKAKGNAQTFAHELGHIFGLQHNDVKTDNLMASFKEPTATLLNKDQMRSAREGAAAFIEAAQPTPTTPTATPPTTDITPTVTPPTTDITPTATMTPDDTAPTPTNTPRPGGDGDANKDGTVDSRDALLLLQWVGGLFTGPLPNADTNTDGTVNAIDGALILQRVAGLLARLPWP